MLFIAYILFRTNFSLSPLAICGVSNNEWLWEAEDNPTCIYCHTCSTCVKVSGLLKIEIQIAFFKSGECCKRAAVSGILEWKFRLVSPGLWSFCNVIWVDETVISMVYTVLQWNTASWNSVVIQVLQDYAVAKDNYVQSSSGVNIYVYTKFISYRNSDVTLVVIFLYGGWVSSAVHGRSEIFFVDFSKYHKELQSSLLSF